ncbi:MAG: peptide deformylase [Chlamydiae bacterium]|nr:peptide deformylase [Chlamydiota bacterium]MBI3276638.1 peptide deformylase [Chlamydiota bacterium]
MAILPVLHLPDPVLNQKSLPVLPPFHHWGPLIHDLVETMEYYPGCVGLAASQVGRLVQVIVVDVRRYRKPVKGHGLQVLLNPKILEKHLPQVSREGCLSVTDYTGNVLRYQEVLVEGLTPQGEKIEIQAEGFEAIVFQHEVDHLEGLLFLDRVSSLKTDIFRRKSFLH